MYSILYVDDEPALLEISKLFLERNREFSVGTVESATAALTLLAEQKYDAIISDYQMPGMDGIEFLKKVRASGNAIPFIIFTGRGREEIVIQALNEGADFYLQKGGDPVSQYAELAHKVRQAVEQRRAQTSIRDHERREADIINFLPDATFAIDRSGHIIAWNRAIEEMTGFPAAEMLGKGDYEYAIPFYGRRQPILIDLIYESDEVIRKNYAHIVHEKDTLIADTALPQPKGVPALLMGKAGPLYNQRGEIVGAIESIRDITEMKKAEEGLRESEGRFAAFMEHLPVTAFIKDDRSTNLYVNPNMVEIFGEHDWIGRSVFEQFPKEAAEKMVEDDQRTIREGYRIATEYLTDKNGRKRIYETHKFRIDRGDKPPLIGGFAIDISDQKEAEQALNKSELRFRELADLLPQIVYEADTAGKLTYANRIAFERFGYSEDDFRQGLNVLQMVAPRDREREAAAFRDIVAGTKPAGPPDEFLALRKDGSTFPVSISSSRVLLEGRIAGLRGIIVDITERKQAEDIIRESEEKYRLLFENANDAIFLNEILPGGMPGRFIIVNQVACHQHGYSPEEFLQLSITDIVLPGDPASIQEVATRIRRDGKATFEAVHRRKDGSVFPVETSIHTFELKRRKVGLSFVRDMTERKLADVALREKEEKYRSTLDALPDAVSVVDRELQVTLANTGLLSWLRTLGSSDAIIGKPLLEAFPFLSPKVPDEYRTVFSSGLPIVTEESTIIGDREVITETRKIPLWEHDEIVAVAAIIRDITDRRRAEEELRRSEERYRNVVEDQTEFIARFLPDGTYVFVNEAYCRYFGLKREEILGHRFRPAIPQEDRARVKRFFASLTPDHPVDSIEHRIIMPDGSLRWHRWTDRAIFDPSGTIAEYQSVGRDITGMKDAEMALRESGDRLKRAEEIGRTGSWVFRLSENAVEASEGARLLYGLGETQWTIDEVRKIPLPEYRPLLDTAFRDLIAGEKPYDIVFRIRRLSDGVILDIHSVAEFDPCRNIVFGVIKDITELKRASDSLSFANRKLKLLSGITRHDITNQLAVLRGYLTVLEEKHPAVSSGGMVTAIKTTTGRISSIIAFTKEYEDIGINPPVWQNARSLVETAGEQVPLGKIHLKNDIPAGTEIFADPLIFRVFYNLMDNAVHHGGKITLLRFFGKISDEGYTIVCEDDGIGVAVDAKEQIFERNFGKDTGLALSLSREILSITGITIRETGEAGKGARFEMVIPEGSYRSTG